MSRAAALRWDDAAEQGAATSHISVLRRPKPYLASCRRADGAVVTYDAGGNNTRESHTYGAPDNKAGRITKVTSQAGAEERSYGKLGELTKEINTIASDTQGASGNSPEV